MCDTCVVSRESRVSNTKALGFNTPPERGATQSLVALAAHACSTCKFGLTIRSSLNALRAEPVTAC
eukprot:5682026-Amphidinium_carterae.1